MRLNDDVLRRTKMPITHLPVEVGRRLRLLNGQHMTVPETPPRGALQSLARGSRLASPKNDRCF
jgi:hypothetical protein